ncbi:MAG TPA: FecR domain-containing protein [Chitinophagaceae bacterium]
MTRELFEKYIEGNCNAQEKEKVARWLLSVSDVELDRWILKYWQTDYPEMPRQQEQLVKERLNLLTKNTGRIVTTNRFHLHRYYVAAASILLIIITGILIISKHPVNTGIANKESQPAGSASPDSWVSIRNDSSAKRTWKLEDGTEVTLFKNSGIRCVKYFEHDRRNIYLEGSAFFHVHKDSKRPFTVYGNNISVTALGTSFLVNAPQNSSAFTVKLFTGKIVVKTTRQMAGWDGNIILQPGMQLQYRDATSPVVSRFNIGKLNNTEEVANSEIRFNNTLLPEVMKKLSSFYNVRIAYDHNDIDKMNFTGVVNQSDDIRSILTIITGMNNLKLDTIPDGFSIKLQKD